MRKCNAFFASMIGLSLCVGSVLAADKPAPEVLFKKLDKDGDSKVSLAEFKGKKEGDKATKAEQGFKARDKDQDGFLTLDEFKARK